MFTERLHCFLLTKSEFGFILLQSDFGFCIERTCTTMNDKIKAQNIALNQISKRLDILYHTYGIHTGLSDPAIWMLYSVFEAKGETITQNDLAAMWFYPKQTVNSTVAVLAGKGYLRLEQLPGMRSGKAVRLTDEGERLCEEKIAPLIAAEERSLMRLTEEEREELVRLTEKQCNMFGEEIAKLTKKGDNSKI